MIKKDYKYLAWLFYNKNCFLERSEIMKLVTFQSIDAVRSLFEKGYLECNKRKIDLEKMGPTYEWIVQKVNKSIKNNFNVS